MELSTTGLREQAKSVLVLRPSVCLSLLYISLVPTPGRSQCIRSEGALDRELGDVGIHSALRAASSTDDLMTQTPHAEVQGV